MRGWFGGIAVVSVLFACSSSTKVNADDADSGSGGQAAGGSTGRAGAGGAAGAGGTSGTGASGGVAGAGASDAGGPEGGAGCPAGMVYGPEDKYCIDSVEVTRLAYADWLATAPSTANQGSECSFNSDFAPNTTGGCVNVASLAPFVPQTCVDWCDAQAFCMSKGRRLCGQIGVSKALPATFLFSVTDSQWYAACSDAGARVHPYGAFQAGKCNDAAAGVGTLASVPYKGTACPGGVGNLYDMSGNAREWIDSCTGNTGDGDQCFILGGSYETSNETALSCKGSSSATRNTNQFPDVGFRCCLNL